MTAKATERIGDMDESIPNRFLMHGRKYMLPRSYTTSGNFTQCAINQARGRFRVFPRGFDRFRVGFSILGSSKFKRIFLSQYRFLYEPSVHAGLR